MKPAKCTECGGYLEVDEKKELGVCPHCNTAFYTEKVINNYNIKAEHLHIENANIKVDSELDALIRNIKYFISTDDEMERFKCRDYLKLLLDKYPSFEQTYETIIEYFTYNYTKFESQDDYLMAIKCFRKFEKLCKDKEKVLSMKKKIALLGYNSNNALKHRSEAAKKGKLFFVLSFLAVNIVVVALAVLCGVVFSNMWGILVACFVPCIAFSVVLIYFMSEWHLNVEASIETKARFKFLVPKIMDIDESIKELIKEQIKKLLDIFDNVIAMMDQDPLAQKIVIV